MLAAGCRVNVTLLVLPVRSCVLCTTHNIITHQYAQQDKRKHMVRSRTRVCSVNVNVNDVHAFTTMSGFASVFLCNYISTLTCTFGFLCNVRSRLIASFVASHCVCSIYFVRFSESRKTFRKNTLCQATGDQFSCARKQNACRALPGSLKLNGSYRLYTFVLQLNELKMPGYCVTTLLMPG